MALEPVTIIALLLAGGLGLFFAVRFLFGGRSGKGPSGRPPQTKEEAQAKDDALEKFKQVHAAARDNRKKISKQVQEDPERATRALRSMMKR